MPKYAGQLTFRRLKKYLMNGQKKSHCISLYLSIPFPFPQHSTKEHLLYSQEILCNFLESPQEHQDETLRQIEHKSSSHICQNGNLFSECSAEINFIFNTCRVFPLRGPLLVLNVEKAFVQGSKECYMLSFTLGNLVLALMTPSVSGMQ